MNDSVIEVPQVYQRRNGVPEVLPADANPMSMIARAVSQGWEPERIKQLMDLNDRFMADQARQAFNEAFAAFKGEAVPIIKNKVITDGPLKGKSYADLFAVVDAVAPYLSKHGLSHSWKLTKDEPQWMEVTCTLKHAKGHSETVSMGGPPDAGGAKNAIQARASSLNYLERYTFLAVTGMSAKDQDNDGRGAGPQSEPDPAGKAKLEACGSLNALQDAWRALTAAQRKTLAAVKEECKQRIQEADKS